MKILCGPCVHKFVSENLIHSNPLNSSNEFSFDYILRNWILSSLFLLSPFPLLFALNVAHFSQMSVSRSGVVCSISVVVPFRLIFWYPLLQLNLRSLGQRSDVKSEVTRLNVRCEMHNKSWVNMWNISLDLWKYFTWRTGNSKPDALILYLLRIKSEIEGQNTGYLDNQYQLNS